MEKIKKICFDLDGTVYDLYGIPDWLPRLRAEDVSAYTIGSPKVDLEKLKEVCEKLIAKNFLMAVITWASMESSENFFKATEKVKRKWVAKNMPYIKECHVQKYGIPKQRALRHGVKNNEVWLVDDNDEVLGMWNGYRIDAKGDIIHELETILRAS